MTNVAVNVTLLACLDSVSLQMRLDLVQLKAAGLDILLNVFESHARKLIPVRVRVNIYSDQWYPMTN